MNVTIKFVLKNYLISFENQLYTTLGKGVDRSVKIFGREFWPKVTFTNPAAVPCVGGAMYSLKELCTRGAM